MIAHAERGVVCGADGVTLGRLRLLQAEAHNWRGEFAKGVEHAAEARARLETSGDSGVGYWADAIAQLNWASVMLGNSDDVDSLAQALLEKANEQLNERLLRAAAHLGGWQVLLGSSAAQHTRDWLHEHGPKISDPLASADVKGTEAATQAVAQNFVAAARLFEAASEEFRQVGNRRLQCMHAINAAQDWSRLGAYGRAETLMRQAIAVTGHAWSLACANGALGVALAGNGQLEAAQRLLEQAAVEVQEIGDPRTSAAIVIDLSRVVNAGGDHACAEAHARAAVKLATGVPTLETYSFAALASALLDQNRAEEALEPARTAFEIAQSLGTMEEGDVFVRLTYAETLHALGNHAEARDVLRAAHQRLLAIAAIIDDENIRRSFLERVPENARTVDLARRWFPTERASSITQPARGCH